MICVLVDDDLPAIQFDTKTLLALAKMPEPIKEEI